MKLILVRHGEAPPDPLNDFTRVLSERGRHQAQATAAYLLPKYQPDAFVVSPLVRAQQTMAACKGQAANSFGADISIRIYDKIKPSDDAEKALEYFSQLAGQCILVVCHMDIISRMHSWLTGESFSPFALAEARVYEQVAIAQGFSTLVDGFIPRN